MKRIKVMIADDSTLLRRLVADQLSREPEITVVGDAADGRAAVEMAQDLHPDVIVLDLDMPEMNGLQAAQRIHHLLPRTSIVLLTGLEQLASLGRSNGVSECLVKNCTPQELAAAVRRAAAANASVISPTSAAVSSERRMSAGIARMAMQAGLTDKERDVVEKMVTTEMTAAQIARALTLDSRSPVSESGVKHALERALNKLGIEPRTRAALIRRVIDAGDTESPLIESG